MVMLRVKSDSGSVIHGLVQSRARVRVMFRVKLKPGSVIQGHVQGHVQSQINVQGQGHLHDLGQGHVENQVQSKVQSLPVLLSALVESNRESGSESSPSNWSTHLSIIQYLCLNSILCKCIYIH